MNGFIVVFINMFRLSFGVTLGVNRNVIFTSTITPFYERRKVP